MSQDIVEIEVSQNRYGIAPVKKERPYLSTDADRRRWMEFNKVMSSVLEGRIDELNGRYQQIVSILYCKDHELYLIDADRTLVTSRSKISYFYDWLYELATVHQIPVANKTTWDHIEMVVQGCLGAKMSFEDAVAIAAHGSKAVKNLEEHGAIVTKSDEATGQLVFERGPRADEVIGPETSVRDYLSDVANTTRSSRGATLRVKSDIGGGKSAVISNVWRDKEEPDLNGMKQFFLGVEEFNPKTGDKVPYDFRVLAESDTPPEVIKYVLRTLGTDKFAKVAFW